ncbi:MAG: MscL family protein [Gemmatimonadetes bacterium]|nr:MscL family protein [Gemmatimonadota bacterium]
MVNELVAFLKQYGVIGLAIAVIIGAKINEVITAVVDGILMPVVGALTPGGDWREMTINVGSVALKIGPVIGASIDFVIVAAIVFIIAKKVLKEETVSKK